jgi:hypothetical protein
VGLRAFLPDSPCPATGKLRKGSRKNRAALFPLPHPLQKDLTCPIVSTYSSRVWYRQNLWVF